MATYTPLQPNQAPIQGTSGSAVLELQKQLNAKGAGLKEDALYGPLTAAAFAKYNTPTPTVDTTKPIGSNFIIPSINNSYETDPDYLAAQEVNKKLLRGEDIVDTSAIRSKTLADFQDRINAINQVYAGKLAEAQQQGVGRVGQTTSVLANRGLAGSARGGAIAEGTLTQNRQIEDAINAEKNAAIQSIYSDVNSTAQAEAERRRQAIEGGAKSYIDFIKNQETTKKENVGNVAGAFLAQGIDPSTMTPDELKGIADKLKVSTADIISAYKQKQFDQKQTELKNAPTPPASVAEYEYAKKNGYTGTFSQYQNEDANRKAKVAGAGAGFTPSQVSTTINSIASSFDNEPIVKNFNILNEGYQYAQSMPNTTKNPSDDQALIYAFAKAMDPNSVVREGEYATVQKYSQSLLNSYGKSVSQAIAGTGFLTPDARANIKKTIEDRYKVSKTNYDALYKQYQKRIEDARAGKGNTLTDYSTAYNTGGGINESDPLGLGI